MIPKFILKQGKRPGFEHRLADHQNWPKFVETSAPAFYSQAAAVLRGPEGSWPATSSAMN
jgi:hypothetical protein